mmetsp:Transcript_114546/g.334931  ORF Transcript_114546/g.334931 Transcript_114546/m.334931 type:complete len:478 (-) Transcript_114546:486-1919(-)
MPRCAPRPRPRGGVCGECRKGKRHAPDGIAVLANHDSDHRAGSRALQPPHPRDRPRSAAGTPTQQRSQKLPGPPSARSAPPTRRPRSRRCCAGRSPTRAGTKASCGRWMLPAPLLWWTYMTRPAAGPGRRWRPRWRAPSRWRRQARRRCSRRDCWRSPGGGPGRRAPRAAAWRCSPGGPLGARWRACRPPARAHSSGAGVVASHKATPGTGDPSQQPPKPHSRNHPAPPHCSPSRHVLQNEMSAGPTAGSRRRARRRPLRRGACRRRTAACCRPLGWPMKRFATLGEDQVGLGDFLHPARVAAALRACSPPVLSPCLCQNAWAATPSHLRHFWLAAGPVPSLVCAHGYADVEAAAGAAARVASNQQGLWQQGVVRRNLHEHSPGPSRSTCRPGSGGSGPAPPGPSPAPTLPRAPGPAPRCARADRSRPPPIPPSATGAVSPRAAGGRAPPEPPGCSPRGSRPPRALPRELGARLEDS